LTWVSGRPPVNTEGAACIDSGRDWTNYLCDDDTAALNQAPLARFGGLCGLARALELKITEPWGIGPSTAARIEAVLEFGTGSEKLREGGQ
jgi:hypothetical protein